MEEIRNRNLGEIYTPTHVAKLLFELTNKYIPEFSKTHTVWDSCWGTGNLTSEIEFDDLYCSTLRMLDIRRHNNKNKEAKKFVYNFLEEDIDQLVSQQAMWVKQHKLPEDLLDKLNGNKPFLFYINPPYVATGVFGATNTDFKEDATKNPVKEIMREQSMGSACDQTYAQFLYRMCLMKEAYENKDMSMAVICPPMYLTGQTYTRFREKLLKNFKFMGGALFKASEFSGLSDAWGISIQIWKPGETLDKNNFTFDLYEKDEKGEFKCFGQKTMYNIDNQPTCMDWVRKSVENLPQRIADVTLSSGCKVSNKKQVSHVNGAIGYFYYKGNNIYHNEQEVGIMALPYSDGSGTSITRENFDMTISTYAARRVYSRYGANWTNDKDEYCVPNINSVAYKKLLMNSYIYTLFNGTSYMASLKFDIDGKITEQSNEFFFISLEKMKNMLEREGITLQGPGKIEDKLMYKKILTAMDSKLLVDKAYDVLNEAIKIYDDTAKFRAEFNNKEPMYQVMNWDAGFYQIKQILKDTEAERFARFNRLYRDFEDDIRPLVHECGFLK